MVAIGIVVVVGIVVAGGGQDCWVEKERETVRQRGRG